MGRIVTDTGGEASAFGITWSAHSPTISYVPEGTSVLGQSLELVHSSWFTHSKLFAIVQSAGTTDGGLDTERLDSGGSGAPSTHTVWPDELLA
jgi:hypothetical protein